MKKLLLITLILLTTPVAAEKKVQNVVWEKAPIVYVPKHVLGQRVNTFKVEIAFIADEQGDIKAADIYKSSGNNRIDSIVKANLLKAKTKPYYENGKPVWIKAVQPFEIENKYIEDGPFYQCWWKSESSIFQEQKNYKTYEDALKKLDYIYLEQPVLDRKYETNNPISKEVGSYDVVIQAKDGYIDKVTAPTAKDLYGLLAIEAVEGKIIQPQKAKWAKTSRVYKDIITLFRECSDKPLK